MNTSLDCDIIRSSLSDVNCGVPQGSVLGPLLFLIYVNDISTATPGSKLKLFANDTSLFISGIDKSELCILIVIFLRDPLTDGLLRIDYQ